MKAAVLVPVWVLCALPGVLAAHTIPDDVAIQMWAKPAGDHLYVLVRLPLDAFADTQFPMRAGGGLDLAGAEAILPGAATTWISDWIDVFENGAVLAKPRIAETRLALPSDNSFASYPGALAHVTGPRLPAVMDVAPNQALVEVLLDYPIRSEHSRFAIHSRLARLAVRVVTLLRFLPDNGGVRAYGVTRTYGFVGDPGVFSLDPRWSDAIARFGSLGFVELLKGSDYLLFLLCAALVLRQVRPLTRFALAFGAGAAITLFASAFDWAPDAVWFPVLFETLVALAIVFVSLEAIVGGSTVRRWQLAFGFGLIFGFAFSFGLRPALQFGGAHALVSVIAFFAGLEAAQIALLLLLTAGLTLAERLGAPERLVTITLAALAAHTGWHRMLDRAQWISPAWMNSGPASLPPPAEWAFAAVLLACFALWFYKTRAWRMTTSHFSRIRRATS